MNSEYLKIQMTFEGVPDYLQWSETFLILKTKKQDL